jgi:hypothetical protein
MTTTETGNSESRLREALQSLESHQTNNVREAYYKSIEGLYALVDSLEIAKSAAGQAGSDVLLEEYLSACAAMNIMTSSMLGRIL